MESMVTNETLQRSFFIIFYSRAFLHVHLKHGKSQVEKITYLLLRAGAA
ncbi:hypothetical protein [Mesobacillus foraminis]|nr:hypothetical protein [Mesobacillus foraminis]